MYFYFSGRLVNVLTPQFRTYLLLAGITLGAMCGVLLFTSGKLHACIDPQCNTSAGPIGGKITAYFLIFIPVILVVIANDGEKLISAALDNRIAVRDSTGLGRRAPNTRAAKSVFLPLPSKNSEHTPPFQAESVEDDYRIRTPEGYIKVEVLDLLYAAQVSSLRRDFEGQTVQLIGQLQPATSHNPKGNRFQAVRMFMMCCAADIRPIGTLVEASQLPNLPKMSWVKITGQALFPIENGTRTTIIKATLVEPTTSPEEQMLY